MTPIDRRTFLANGVRTTVAVAAVGPLLDLEQSAPAGASTAVATQRLVAASGALTVGNLTVNGKADPVGIDPDACFFAWTVRSAGRGARQRGYRITVRRADPQQSAVVWDSGAVPSARQAFVSYDGPTLQADAAYTWTVMAQDEAGDWSPPSAAGQFVTTLRLADWTADWLRPQGGSQQPDIVTYVRTVITPPAGTLRRVTAFTSAAHTYRLFVNDAQVDFGPSFSYPDEQYVRSVDLTKVITPGTPVGVGLLHRWYGPGQGRPMSAPGVIMQLSLHYSDGRHVTFGTDGTWKELPAEWLPSPLRNTDGSDFVEWIDGRAHPQGWSTAGFDASAWGTPQVLGPAGTSPYSNMFAQRTDIDELVVAPVSVRTLSTGSVVVDFGKVYAARPTVRFEHGASGRTIPMHVGYLLDPDGQVSTIHGTQETNLSFSYITRQGAESFEPLTYLGFRYLQIDSPGETIGADQVTAVAQHAAMPDVPMATFSTGDRMLNAVWALNARSCLYCTHEQFVDTPTREKGQFLWDASEESEGIMRTYGDQNMTWQGLRDVTRGQARFWPDGNVNAVYPNGDGARTYGTFTERYPEWLWRYYVATGDRTTLLALYPSVTKVADYIWANRDPATGLINGFADGSDGDPVYGYDQSVTEDTTSNVLGVNALRRIGQMATLAGDPAGAATQAARATQLAEAINTRIVRPDGIYTDGLLPSGAQSGHASQLANVLPLAYGIVPADRVDAVGAYVVKLGISVGPNHGLELLRSLAGAGLLNDMVHTLTDTSIPGWAHIVSVGGTFTWEVWQPSDLIGDSMSHGWGSSALVAMHESLLGLTLLPAQTEAGTVYAGISPPTSGVSAARGSLPSIAGPVAVDWSRRGKTMTLSADIPTNATAQVTLPATGASSVRESGAALAHAPGVTVVSAHDGVVVLSVGSGSYRFTSTFS